MFAPPSLRTLVVALTAAFVAAACSSSDPGSIPLSDKTPRVGGNPNPASPSTDDAGPAKPATPLSVDASLPPSPAFQGAPAYVATSGQSTTKSNHGGSGDPPTHDCLSACHKANGTAPEMTIGGWVGDASGNPVGQVEVRVVDGTGAEAAKAYTNAKGYFFVLGRALSGSFDVGIRDATRQDAMSAKITKGSCGDTASCHGSSAQGDVTLR